MRLRGYERIVHALGLIIFCCLLCMTVLSFSHAAVLWHLPYAPRAAAFLSGITDPLAGFAWYAQLMGDAPAVIVTHSTLLAIASTCAALLLALLMHAGDEVDKALRRRVLAWAVAFGIICTPAYPVFTQDMWLSVAWGKMILSGINPYHTILQNSAMDGLPLDHFPMTMSYGPLWALISAACGLFTDFGVVAVFVICKLVLLSAWLSCLYLVDRLAVLLEDVRRSSAIVIFAWLPISPLQTVAEGHNDIVMSVLVVVWLVLLVRRRHTAPIALMLSTLVKYASGPLFLADATYNISARQVTFTAYAKQLTLAFAILIAGVLLFFRSTEFFNGLFIINSWKFLQPADAIRALGVHLQIDLQVASLVVAAIFPLVAMWQLFQTWRTPSHATLIRSAIAITSAMALSAINHVWPWYMIWLLPLAALAPRWWLSRFVISLAILMPFTVAIWWIEALEVHRGTAAIMMYACAVIMTVATPANLRSLADKLRIDRA